MIVLSLWDLISQEVLWTFLIFLVPHLLCHQTSQSPLSHSWNLDPLNYEDHFLLNLVQNQISGHQGILYPLPCLHLYIGSFKWIHFVFPNLLHLSPIVQQFHVLLLPLNCCQYSQIHHFLLLVPGLAPRPGRCVVLNFLHNPLLQSKMHQRWDFHGDWQILIR